MFPNQPSAERLPTCDVDPAEVVQDCPRAPHCDSRGRAFPCRGPSRFCRSTACARRQLLSESLAPGPSDRLPSSPWPFFHAESRTAVSRTGAHGHCHTEHPWVVATRDQIAEGRYDIGLCADEIETTHVAAQSFMTPRAVCVMPQGHPLTAKTVVDLVALAEHPFIALSPEDTVQRQLLRICAEAEVQLRVAVETQYSETVCNLALEGVGVGLANAIAVKASSFTQRGLVVRPFEPPLHFKALLVTHPTRIRSALADRFMTCLFEVRNQLGAG